MTKKTFEDKYEIVPFDAKDIYYRDMKLTHVVQGYLLFVNEIRVAICKCQAKQKWWIVPNSHMDDPHFEAFGPFDTHLDAMVYASLLGETIRKPSF